MLKFLFPHHCISCQKLTHNNLCSANYLCSDCLNKIRVLEEKSCLKSHNLTSLNKQKNSIFLKDLIVSAKYDNPILKEAIHCFKYRYIKSLAFPLASLMKQRVKHFPDNFFNNSLLLPIPLSKKRLKERGFNQSYLLCENLSNWLNIPINSAIMKRVKFTRPQAEIENYQKRQQNVRKNFQLNANVNLSLIKNKKVVLVDDVTTTSATLEECAKILKPYVKEVWGWTLAG